MDNYHTNIFIITVLMILSNLGMLYALSYIANN